MMASTERIRNDWVSRQRELLVLDKEAEAQQLEEKISRLSAHECQDLGLSMLSLDIEGTNTSMFGRCCMTLKRCDSKPLRRSQFKVGDEVTLYSPKLRHTPEAANSETFGIVSKITTVSIEIVCGDEIDPENFKPPLRLDLRASEQTHKKMVQALADLEKDCSNPLTRLLFFPSMKDATEGNMAALYPGWSDEINHVDDTGRRIKFINPNLNPSQQDAIRCALSASHIALIHGPPGTGKTSTVTELILQAAAAGQKILVCAPSNVAVDNVLERLVTSSATASGSKSASVSSDSDKSGAPRVLRLGHPARVSPHTLRYCLDALIVEDEGTEIVRDVRKEMDNLRKAMTKSSSGRGHSGGINRSNRREQQQEMSALRKEVRKREEHVVRNILSSRNVILSTCVGASSKLLKDIEFDLVVIDEAGQALEASCWIPLLRGRKCVLAGDHKQLAPTIKSTEAEKKGLGVTLFERVINCPLFKKVTRMLTIQYRMNSLISTWASNETYGGLLTSHESVATHRLDDLLMTASSSTPLELENKGNSKLKGLPVLLLLDTAKGNYTEESCDEGSHRNYREAELVRQHVRMLVTSGIRPDQIGIITPYNGQLELLRQLLFAPEDDDSDSRAQGEPLSEKEKLALKRRLALRLPECESVQSGPRLDGLEIRTVDGFQGGEKECIILSLVRSNDVHEVGFLADSHRINVAVTRARRQLTIICDADTCSSDPTLRSLIRYSSRYGSHKSVVDLDLDNDKEYGEFCLDEDEDEEDAFDGSMKDGVDDHDDDNDNDDDDDDDGNDCVDMKNTNKIEAKGTVKDNSSTKSRADKKKKKKKGELLKNKTDSDNGKLEPTSNVSSSESVKSGGQEDIFISQVKSILSAFKAGELKSGAYLEFDANEESLKLLQRNPELDKVDKVDIGGGILHELQFPSNLSSNQRRLIHATCDEMGPLYHVSRDGATPGERFLVVSKTPLLSTSSSFPAAKLTASTSPSLATSTGSTVSTVSTGKSKEKGEGSSHKGQESVKGNQGSPGSQGSQQKKTKNGKKSLPPPPPPPQISASKAAGLAALKRFEAKTVPPPVAGVGAEGGGVEEDEDDAAGKGGAMSLALDMDSDEESDDDTTVDPPNTTTTTSMASTSQSNANNAQVHTNTNNNNNNNTNNNNDKNKGNNKGNNKGKGDKAQKSFQDMDEMEALELAIQANKEHANYHKLRLPSTPLPNFEKEKRKEALHQRLQQAQLARATDAVKEMVEEKGKAGGGGGGGGNKKVLKKPPRKLGSAL